MWYVQRTHVFMHLETRKPFSARRVNLLTWTAFSSPAQLVPPIATVRTVGSPNHDAARKVCCWDSRTKSGKLNIGAWKGHLYDDTPMAQHIVDTLKTAGWTVELDSFKQKTPVGPRTFHNISASDAVRLLVWSPSRCQLCSDPLIRFTSPVATWDPQQTRRLVVSAHYESKEFATGSENVSLACWRLGSHISSFAPFAHTPLPGLRAVRVTYFILCAARPHAFAWPAGG